MKQIWPTYAYSPTTNVLTLTGLNIDRDQLLLVTAADRGRIMYNFADSSVTASAFTSGANTALTLVATTAGLTTTAALVIYFDDQATSSTVTGTVELGPTSLNALESITVTMGQVTVTGGLTDTQLRASAVTVGGTVTVGNSLTIGFLPALSAGTAQIGVVTANVGSIQVKNLSNVITSGYFKLADDSSLIISGMGDDNAVLSQISSALPAGTNRIGVVTIGGGTVTIGAGTAQIGSVTASISGTVPISISSVTVGVLPDLTTSTDFEQAGTQIAAGITNYGSIPVAIVAGPVTIGSALPAGTNQIGSVTVGNSVTIGSLPAISGTVTANTFALQGTAVTTSNFTSTTASTVLANYNATREVLTIFNEGAGNLHICAGATCTTIAYQVRLSAGDYYEVPNHQTTITHSAVFATAGTARVTEVI
jgi:hypothetical protein